MEILQERNYPFHDDNWCVMRHKKNKKTFAIIYDKDGYVWINVKCFPSAKKAVAAKGMVLIMNIYDISQEVFSCKVYPGDPMPEKKVLNSMEKGELYNLTSLSMCTHNGTHIDAPRHFIKNGKAVDELSLDSFVGMAYVAEHCGVVTEDDALKIIEKAKTQNVESAKRILIKGDAEVSLEAAKVFASSNILLLGNESQTVGPQNTPMEVHLALLSAGVILLEGIRLEMVSEGIYLLNAAPLNLAGADGSPCRAVLIDD